MAGVCLPIEQAQKFIQALKDGIIDPGKLAEMASEERRSFFSHIVGEADAREVNALFESKLLLKNQQAGLINWAKKVSGISEVTRRDLFTKIQKMDRVLNPADEESFLADLARKKLGTEVTIEQAKTISELSRKVQDTAKNGDDSLSGVSNEHLNARQNLSSYVNSLKEGSAAKNIANNVLTTWRNMIVGKPSVFLKNIMNQFTNAVMDRLTSRISNLSAGGKNPELASQILDEAKKSFAETRLNTLGMESISDSHTMVNDENLKVSNTKTVGGKIVGGIESTTRMAARISNKVAIDWGHVIAFTKVYQSSFVDMANIVSTRIAEGEGLEGEALKTRAAEILKDSARIEPLTEEGQLVRTRAQEQAARVTSVNDTVASRLSLLSKQALNKVIPGVPLGNYLIPVAKIPATAIWNGIENAGLGFATGAYDIVKGQAKIASEDPQIRNEGLMQYGKGMQTMARTVGTVAFSAYVVSQMPKEDFRTDNYGNHFVKIAGVWINLEYVSAFSPAMGGMMRAKIDGDGLGSDVEEYVKGASVSLQNIPGVVSGLDNLLQMGVTKSLQSFIKSGEGIFANIGKDRFLNRLIFGANGVETQEQVNKDTADASAKAEINRKANKAKANAKKYSSTQ